MHPKPSNYNPDSDGKEPSGKLKVTITSFGYKEGPPPIANMVFDVRFLKNPYWVPELRPLTGIEKPVKDYVLTQEAAQEFLNSLTALLQKVLPEFRKLKLEEFALALGCTGGQHRSPAMVEAIAEKLAEHFPDIVIERQHRQLLLASAGEPS
jgi:UPF0042 nucleotide-binding protein